MAFVFIWIPLLENIASSENFADIFLLNFWNQFILPNVQSRVYDYRPHKNQQTSHTNKSLNLAKFEEKLSDSKA